MHYVKSLKKIVSSLKPTFIHVSEEDKLIHKVEQLIKADVLAYHNPLVQACFAAGILSYDDIKNPYPIYVDPEDKEDLVEYIEEFYAWHFVTERLADKLESFQLPMIRNSLGRWWGRSPYDGSLCFDYFLQQIAQVGFD